MGVSRSTLYKLLEGDKMIDFTNKCIVTENNVESEQLLKKQ